MRSVVPSGDGVGGSARGGCPGGTVVAVAFQVAIRDTGWFAQCPGSARREADCHCTFGAPSECESCGSRRARAVASPHRQDGGRNLHSLTINSGDHLPLQRGTSPPHKREQVVDHALNRKRLEWLKLVVGFGADGDKHETHSGPPVPNWCRVIRTDVAL